MADMYVPPDCLNGYDCYWLFFCLFTGIPNLDALYAEYYEDLQRTTKTICTTYCYILLYPVVYTVIQLLLLYISLYLYYIWYRFSYLWKSILLFGEMTKLVLTVVYAVIYSYLVILLLYISYIYSILL